MFWHAAITRVLFLLVTGLCITGQKGELERNTAVEKKHLVLPATKKENVE